MTNSEKEYPRTAKAVAEYPGIASCFPAGGQVHKTALIHGEATIYGSESAESPDSLKLGPTQPLRLGRDEPLKLGEETQ